MVAIIIVALVVGAFYVFLFNKGTKAIRSVNSLINIDRSVCDAINEYPGWYISPAITDGIKLIIVSTLGGTYNLYLTYNDRRPTNDEMAQLDDYLKPIVKLAHSVRMSVADFLLHVDRQKK